ncbi:MAG: sulfate ABC transporter substrate-binding protein [Deltaproteobacteria bacterium]|nr:sulfate ABC transporter substrate-binding protein [Deltaproteobacteria bacterium]
MNRSFTFTRRLVFAAAVVALGCSRVASAEDAILNASYDPTRELFVDYNKLFTEHWKKTKGATPQIKQSHGGSGKQARAVIDGLPADVVTLALALDVDAIAEKSDLLPKNWQSKLPDNSTPYTSTIVFVVRKNNPKGIKDWGDLTKAGTKVITPNPKTSGGARWNYLAAWAWATKQWKGDNSKTQGYIRDLFKNVPVLDSGARGATTTFAQRGIGDVLISWESEAHLILREFGADKFAIVVPSLSILAEPSVAVVEKVASKRGTLALAQEYLRYLYAPQAQEIIAKNFYRPRDKAVAAKWAAQFPKIELVTVAKDFGGWQAAQKAHFADGASFDQIYATARR